MHVLTQWLGKQRLTLDKTMRPTLNVFTTFGDLSNHTKNQWTYRLVIALLCSSLLVCQGCSTVSPWQRGNLAKPEMGINPHPNLNSFRDHIFTSKEASQGGHSGAGGGCGCN
jgi:hypothetical protein